jgi:GxxExxY protein
MSHAKTTKNAKKFTGLQVEMNENEVARQVVDACYNIHTELGTGMLESAYERVLAHELTIRGLAVRCQAPIDIYYGDLHVHGAFVADIVVEGKVIIELKSIAKVAPIHTKQLLTYLQLSNLRLGLLINFGEPYIGSGITRVVNGLLD